MEELKTLTEENLEVPLTLFPGDSLARISVLPKHRKKMVAHKASKVRARASGRTTRVLWGRLCLASSSLKTAQCSLVEDLSTSYATFPSSGMMLNGDCFMLPSSVFRTKEKGYTPLPTPSASDGIRILKKVASYKKYYRNKHQDKTVYQCHLNGLTASQTLMLYEWMMGFPLNWTDKEYMGSAMQLYHR